MTLAELPPIKTRLLTIQSAWKIARGLDGVGRFTEARTNMDGAFGFRTEDGSPLILIDALVVPEEAQRHFSRHCQLQAGRVFIRRVNNSQSAFKSEQEIAAGFMNPFDSQAYDAPVWVLKGPAWCLAHIFAGLRVLGFTDGEAIEEYGTHYGPSKHQQLHARDWLARTSPEA